MLHGYSDRVNHLSLQLQQEKRSGGWVTAGQLVAPATLSAAQSLTLLVSSYQPRHTLQCPEVSPPAVVLLCSPLLLLKIFWGGKKRVEL